MTMTNQKICCNEMTRHVSEQELGLIYIDKFREFGIEYRDGGTSYQHIKFCPFCGAHFSLSLRNKWFDELEKKGVDPCGNDIPKEYQSSEWWLKDYD